MSIARLARTLAVTAVGGVLAASTYGAQAARAPAAPTHHAQVHATVHDTFVAPKPHKMRPGSNLPMGMHCDSTDMSM